MSMFRETINESLAHRGVIISDDGYIYRLSISPAQKARITENRFDPATNTVLGAATCIKEYASATSAIYAFGVLKEKPGYTWRRDETVRYRSSPVA